jgi:hypothetical protein
MLKNKDCYKKTQEIIEKMSSRRIPCGFDQACGPSPSLHSGGFDQACGPSPSLHSGGFDQASASAFGGHSPLDIFGGACRASALRGASAAVLIRLPRRCRRYTPGFRHREPFAFASLRRRKKVLALPGIFKYNIL